MSAAAILDAMPEPQARAALTRCCGATAWVDRMLRARPFGSDAALHDAADAAWAQMDRDAMLQAFAHHPEIGASLDALRQRFTTTAGWSTGEQAGVAGADEAVLVALRDGNVRYRERFGFVFLVCATGKTAVEMLELLRARLPNAPADEIAVAAREQAKIMHLRLDKLAAPA